MTAGNRTGHQNRFVVVKRQAQDASALHQVRALLIRERTALMNQMRGLLVEGGIVIAQGSTTLRRKLAEPQDQSENGSTLIVREILGEMSERLRLFEERLKNYTARITGLANDGQRVVRLVAVEGVGPITLQRWSQRWATRASIVQGES